VHALLQLTGVEEAIGNVYNVGSSVETAIIELAGHVLARTGSDSKVRLVPFAEAYEEGFEELGRRRPDTSAIAELVGWQPSRTLDETIDDLVAYERGRTQPATGSLRLAG
jgi:UDP-glucose 4-epimerase